MPVGACTPRALSVSATCLCHSMSVKSNLEPRLPAPPRPEQPAEAVRTTPARWPRTAAHRPAWVPSGRAGALFPFSFLTYWGPWASHLSPHLSQIIQEISDSLYPTPAELNSHESARERSLSLLLPSDLDFCMDEPVLVVVFYRISLVKSASCHSCPNISTQTNLSLNRVGPDQKHSFS